MPIHSLLGTKLAELVGVSWGPEDAAVTERLRRSLYRTRAPIVIATTASGRGDDVCRQLGFRPVVTRSNPNTGNRICLWLRTFPRRGVGRLGYRGLSRCCGLRLSQNFEIPPHHGGRPWRGMILTVTTAGHEPPPRGWHFLAHAGRTHFYVRGTLVRAAAAGR